MSSEAINVFGHISETNSDEAENRFTDEISGGLENYGEGQRIRLEEQKGQGRQAARRTATAGLMIHH